MPSLPLGMQQSGFEGGIEAAVSKLQEAVDGTMQSMEVRVRVRVCVVLLHRLLWECGGLPALICVNVYVIDGEINM